MSDDDTTKKVGTDTQDWSAFDAMTDAERHAAALADPDAQPLSERDMSRMKRVPRVTTIRRALHLTLDAFAARYKIPLAVLEEWESGRTQPDATASAYLAVIARAPDMVREALDTTPRAAE